MTNTPGGTTWPATMTSFDDITSDIITSSTLSAAINTLSPKAQLVQDIKEVLFPIIVSVGILANAFSFTVVVTRGLINSSVGVYLASLAIFDSISLATTYLYDYAPMLFGINFTIYNNLSCKLFEYTNLCATLISNYIVMTMTLERAYVILMPYSTHHPGKRGAAISVLCVMAIILTWESKTLITYSVMKFPVDDTGTEYFIFCTWMDKYDKFATKYMPWMDLMSFTLLPSIVIICANIAIVATLIIHSRSKHISSQTNSKRTDQIRLTYMLMTVSIFFVVVTLQGGLYYSFAPDYFYDSVEEAFSPENEVWAILLIIGLLNYSCNLWLYLLSGRKFREEARELVKSWFKFCGLVKQDKHKGMTAQASHINTVSTKVSNNSTTT